MSKLWIIGDSFAGFTSCGKQSWPEILADKFIDKNHFISSRASRDFQTILDIFLRQLKNIDKDDFVILIIPFIGRTRLPLDNPVNNITNTNFYTTEEGKIDYFIGTQSYTSESEYYKLETPLTYAPQKEIIKNTELWSIVNSSDASKTNYIEILKSLKEYFAFEIFIWSWENEFESDLIVSKSKITEEIGFWHTYEDLYLETGGKEGYKRDSHFSPKMHIEFAKYVIKSYPQYFEQT